MPARLTNGSQKTLLAHLCVARSLRERTQGLIGCKSLPQDCGLWIQRCNSVHTFFMSFSIDLIFLDKNLVVKRIVAGVKPRRLVLPVWRATSVVEVNAGFLQINPIRVGDQLYVDHSVS